MMLQEEDPVEFNRDDSEVSGGASVKNVLGQLMADSFEIQYSSSIWLKEGKLPVMR
jgi:hypothetical protein